ncbi:MAG: hypothetical protein PHF74_00935 [Dehalococcoidales bacterium]|nr:hypothetical protein [Dehalococcoidales bacterium]
MVYDTIIIGAVWAGITACIYAARKKMNALLISADIGGQINTTWGIENYIGYQFIEGPELIDKFNTQLTRIALPSTDRRDYDNHASPRSPVCHHP